MKCHTQTALYKFLFVALAVLFIVNLSLVPLTFAEGGDTGDSDGPGMTTADDDTTGTGTFSSMADTVARGGTVSMSGSEVAPSVSAQAVADMATDMGVSGVSVSETAGGGYSVSAEPGGEGGNRLTYSAGCILAANPTLIHSGDDVVFTWEPDYNALSCNEGDPRCGDMVDMEFDNNPVSGTSITIQPTQTSSHAFSARIWTGYGYGTAVCVDTVTVSSGSISDLSVISTGPAHGADFNVGDTINFSGVMTNLGPEALSSTVRNVLEIDKDFDGVADITADVTTAAYNKLEVGDTAVLTHALEAPAPWHYQWRFRVDADDQIGEASESNNVSDWQTFRVVSGSCWVANPDRTPRTCTDICAIGGGVPAASVFQCISGEYTTQPAVAYEVDGTPSNGIEFHWGFWRRSIGPGPTYDITATSPGTQQCIRGREGEVTCTGGPEFCYAPGQRQDNDRTDYIVGCNCAMPPSYDCATVPTVPVCSDGIDNDGDGMVDYPNDAGCSDVNDTDESNTPVTITANPTVANVGDTVTLTWTGSGDCSITETIADRTPTVWLSGLTTGGSASSPELIRNTAYTIDCGTAGSDSVTVEVNLSLSVSANPVLVRKGEPVTISWTNDIRTNAAETNLVSCDLTPGTDFVGTNFRTSGSATAYPQHEVIYNYECTFPNGWFYGLGTSGSDSVRVQVLPELWET